MESLGTLRGPAFQHLGVIRGDCNKAARKGQREKTRRQCHIWSQEVVSKTICRVLWVFAKWVFLNLAISVACREWMNASLKWIQVRVGRFISGAATHRLTSVLQWKGAGKVDGNLGGLVGRGVMRGFLFSVSRLEVIIEGKQCKRKKS